MSTQDEPQIKLARDEFTSERRRLDGHPEAVKAQTRIDVTDEYDNITTWVIDLYRLRDERKKQTEVIALLQRGAPDGYIRLVVPAPVTDAFIRHAAGLVSKQRKKTGRRIAADKRARGEKLGNPEALAKARKTRKKR